MKENFYLMNALESIIFTLKVLDSNNIKSASSKEVFKECFIKILNYF